MSTIPDAFQDGAFSQSLTLELVPVEPVTQSKYSRRLRENKKMSKAIVICGEFLQ
jgi:hypothetical protein